MAASKRPSDRPRGRRLSSSTAAAATAAALAVLAALGACSPRTLLVVESCSDAGGGTCPPTPDATLRRGLVGLWHFDDAAGSAVAADSSGNGNDGNLMDLDPVTAWVAGRNGGALQIGGAGYVEVPLQPSVDGITAAVTAAAWISVEGTAVEYGTALSRQIGGGIDQYYHISVNVGDRPVLFIGTTVPSPQNAMILAPSAVPRATFTHIAGTYDGEVARLYVDGVQVGTMATAGTFGDDSTPLILGANANAALGVTERFPGRIDEIALYDRALDRDEVARLAAGALFSFSATRAIPADR
jgi:hypothetical protein